MPPVPDRTVALQRIVDQIEIAEAASLERDFTKIPKLESSIPKLEELAAAKDSTAAAAHYYLARIADLVSQKRLQDGAQIDPALTQEAVAHYGAIIAYGKDIPEWKISIVNVEYSAGNSAFRGKSYDMAITYWRLCATDGHAGCMNSLAYASLRGSPPSERSLEEAFTQFQAAADSGIKYRCAALYSSVSLAYFVHFHVANAHAGTDLDWLRKARDLSVQLQKQQGTKDPCDGASIGVDEYLMRADTGDKQPALLEAVVRDSANPVYRGIAEYLLGTLDESALQAKLSIEPMSARERCEVHFYALWNNVRLGNRTAAQKHYAAMAGLEPDNCLQSQLIARKLELR